MDQQPLKTAQFYVIPRKCEELARISHEVTRYAG